jgi:hypothetical protein
MPAVRRRFARERSRIWTHDPVNRRVGFAPAPVASSRLIDAVAASLAFGAASLCLISSLKVLGIKLAALPIPML